MNTYRLLPLLALAMLVALRGPIRGGELPEKAAKLVEDFKSAAEKIRKRADTETATIQKNAEIEIKVNKVQLVKDLIALKGDYAKDKKLDEALAIEEYLEGKNGGKLPNTATDLIKKFDSMAEAIKAKTERDVEAIKAKAERDVEAIKAKAEREILVPQAKLLKNLKEEQDRLTVAGRLKEAKVIQEFIKKTRTSGDATSDEAVALALKWITQHQSKEGYWSLHAFPDDASEDGKPAKCNCENPGVHNDVAGTAFGLLPLLGAGITPTTKGKESQDYTKNVDLAIKWLIAIQKTDGAFVVKNSDRNAQTFMYSHGLATIAMCEAAGMAPDQPAIRESAQKAITFIVKAQHDGGGWRYRAGDPGDLSVTSWQMSALQSGKLAGFIVPASTFEKVAKFLNQVQYKEDGGGYGYVSGPGSEEAILQQPTMTAAGLVCREYLGWGPRNENLIKGVDRLSKLQPTAQRMNMYFYYYATQVMHNFGGQPWKDWNLHMRDLLIKKQDKGTEDHQHQIGSFSPAGDQWGGAGGRLMETSLCTLTLEVPYQHLALFRQKLAGDK